MPIALYALTAGAFGIGVTEFVIMGLLREIGADLSVSIAQAGLLISGYALGVVFGAPIMTILTARMPRKRVLLGLMVIFIIGNIVCAIAPTYSLMMVARMVTALAHGTFFGVGSVVATSLVAENKRASAIAVMFTGLTVANVLGVPFGTWLGQTLGWRSTFWAVSLVGIAALLVIAALLPKDDQAPDVTDWRADLRAIGRLPVLLGLATTVFGYAGVFTVFTYIAPLLTQVAGLSDSAVSPILLVFGGGMIIGNILGGKLADRNLGRTLTVTLIALGLSLGLMPLFFASGWSSVLIVGLTGIAAFATVAPLQMWVMGKAKGAGEVLVSSFNIAAFNLGNALGAWAGGYAIDHGPGLAAVPYVAVVFPVLAVIVAWLAMRGSQDAPEVAVARPTA
ncbi:arabinose transporter permease [Rhizobium sp. Root149]|jgi:DHA1 family inner membrane transport protein|uniref:MFS transporter n=1 Tax=Rhizobium sp. Root149 TaxID=1736473 RepID=UPI000713D6CE|nr:MFS transporter [Rhizobium sp. Root149]KQZ63174.1 arabinose transporter permease [Rhizobium sp. Root149]